MTAFANRGRAASVSARVRGRVLAMAAVCCFLAAGAAPGAYSAARPRYGGELRISFHQTAQTHHPAAASTLPERVLASALYETLVTLDEHGEPAPGLAVRWQPEPGEKRWEFQLRAGVRFHDGAPFNSTAARETLARALERAPGLAGARLRAARMLCASPSPARLVCDLGEPIPALPRLLADPALAVIAASGAGTGPWTLAAWTRGSHARLEAFEAYHSGRPFLDAIEAEFGVAARRQRVEFELKRADIVVAPPTEARLPGASRGSPESNLLLLRFGAGAFGKETADRRRFAALVDRAALAQLLPPGRVSAAHGFMPGAATGYEFLLGLEQQGVAETGGAGAARRGPLRLVFDAADPVARLAASRLQLDLGRAGVTLRLEGLRADTFAAARQARTYDLAVESLTVRLASSPLGLAHVMHAIGLSEAAGRLLDRAGGQVPVEVEYQAERQALDALEAVPLLHYGDQYGVGESVEQLRFSAAGLPDLASAWKR